MRMVLEQRADYSFKWKAIESIAPTIGCTPQTLLKWIKRTAIDKGTRDRVTTAERESARALEREVTELRRLCSSVDAWQWLVGEIVGAAEHLFQLTHIGLMKDTDRWNGFVSVERTQQRHDGTLAWH